MASLVKYRVWCVTESAYHFTDYLDEEYGPPTQCPVDPAHTIDPTKTTVVSRQEDYLSKVQVIDEVIMKAEIQDGKVSRNGDLSIDVRPFHFEIDGVLGSFQGASNQAVANNSVNYVFLDYDGSLNINTTGWPTNAHIRLARVQAANGLILQIINARVLLTAGIDKEIHEATAEGQDSTSSTDWQQKLRLSMTGIPDGKYIVQWYCELRHSNNTASERAEMRIEVNDMTEIGYSIWPYNLFEDSGGFAVTDLSAGDYTIDLDWRQQGGGTAYIRRARLLFWRIA